MSSTNKISELLERFQILTGINTIAYTSMDTMAAYVNGYDKGVYDTLESHKCKNCILYV